MSKIEQFPDRIAEAHVLSVVTAYENHIRTLEARELEKMMVGGEGFEPPTPTV